LQVFTRFGSSAGLRQGFNRLEITAKGDVSRTVYQDSKLIDGSTASNDDRNYDQCGGVLRGSYETMPGVGPFVEFGADQRVYDAVPDLSGYDRNSKGLTGKVGTTFELTGYLTGEFAIGYPKHEYADSRLEPTTMSATGARTSATRLASGCSTSSTAGSSSRAISGRTG
jgi:hypothetical protein